MKSHPNASYSFTVRLQIKNVPGMFSKTTAVIGREGGALGAVDLVKASPQFNVRDIVVFASDAEHADRIISKLDKFKGAKVLAHSDRTFLVHLKGKMEIAARTPVRTRDDLSMVYTPGVGRICTAIYEKPSLVWNLTVKGNMVAVVTDGTAVLGLGDIGPEAALPVMEGKAILFKSFAGIDAFPICLDTKDTQEIIDTVCRIAPGFGGINLEDISAPRCFEIEAALKKRLNIPVMHDDQHGTAVVVLAGMINALKVTRRSFSSVRAVVAGAGASAVAVTNMLRRAGMKDIICCDRAGAIFKGRKEHMNSAKEILSKNTNPRRYQGNIKGALKGAHVFIGLSQPGSVKLSEIRGMAKKPIIFALANPTPEIAPESINGFAKIIATGRSDYPNQINNALAFPGIFRGALDVRAKEITEGMKYAAARAIASVITPKELSQSYIVPSIFNSSVAEKVAREVAKAAVRAGVARRKDQV